MAAPDDQHARRAEGLLRLAGERRSDDGPRVALDGAGAALIAGSPDGIALLDPDGIVVAWNPAAARLFGIERGAAIGQDLAALVFPEHLQTAVRNVLQRQVSESAPSVAQREIELNAIRADRREIPVDITTAVIGGDSFPLLAVYLRDASERIERERELHADARRRSAVLDLGQVALEGLGLDELLRRAVGLAMEELAPTRCEIWAVAGDELQLRASAGWPAGRDEVRIPLEASNQPGYTVLRGHGALVVEDFRREGRFSSVEPLDAQPLQSAISIRIGGEREPFGTLVVASDPLRRFDLSDISLLESIGQLLGAAIERTRVSDSLAEAEQRVRSLIERLPSITYQAELGPGGAWAFISPQVEEILGYTVAEWRADPALWEKRLHPDDLGRVLAEESRCVDAGESLDVEYRIRKRDGEMIWIRDRASVGVLDEGGAMMVEGLLTDVTEQKAAEERLRFLADHDELTGLLNRRGFELAADAAIADATTPAGRGAVLVVDIDHLKRVNDTLGRSAGDRAIAAVASTLAERIDPAHVFGRLDGNEFALLIPGADEERALERAADLLAAVRARQGAVELTASAGVAMVEADQGVNAADLLTAAEIALHQSKGAGRDRATVFTGEDQGRLEWVGHVRKAVEEERLVLYAQPIVDMATGAHHTEELLVRMLDPVSGRPISAAEFVPTAERFGLIRNLDHWVVRQALRLAASGRRISANISASSIGDRDLTEMIATELHASGADPALLTFELTETAATPAIDSLRDFTSRIQQLGCGLSLDDVGTGFGSLTYLRHLPFTELKIDMQFVRGMLDANADARIVESLVLIARGLGIRTVAEGVESAALIEPLRELGVDYGQGYLFGRPAPIEVPD